MRSLNPHQFVVLSAFTPNGNLELVSQIFTFGPSDEQFVPRDKIAS